MAYYDKNGAEVGDQRARVLLLRRATVSWWTDKNRCSGLVINRPSSPRKKLATFATERGWVDTASVAWSLQAFRSPRTRLDRSTRSRIKSDIEGESRDLRVAAFFFAQKNVTRIVTTSL